VSTRTRLAAAAFCLVAAVLPWAPARAAEPGGLTIRSAEVATFPTVRLTVSTSSAETLSAGDVQVVENGVPVEVVNVEPLDALGQPVDAVLAIDVSNSMRGASLQTAVAAAETFLARVPASMPVGIVTFAEQPVVRAPVSTDRVSAREAVGAIGANTSQGTALFDAVVAATGMFDATDEAQHNVILVTDGQNTVGTADVGAATAVATEAGVHVFTIGLSGPGTDEATLRALALDTGGAYSAISPTELTSVYSGIADELIHQYVVEYRSKAPYGVTVDVTLEIPAGTASIGFLAPGLEAVPPAGGNDAIGTTSVFEEPWAMWLVVTLTFGTAFGLMAVVAQARDRRRRETQLRSRVEAPTGPAWESPLTVTGSNPSLVPKQIAEMAERGLSAGRRQFLAGRLRQAGWSLGAGDFLALVLVIVLVAAGAGWYLFGPVGALAASAAAATVPSAVLSSAAARRLAQIQAQLPDTLMIIAGAMRSGHSFLQALDTAAKEIDEPAASEFGQVLAEVRLGRNIDDGLDALVLRVGSTDLEWTVTAIKIQRQVGGNLAEVLETVANTIRERETLRRQVKVLSAEGRLSMLVLFVLPIVIAVYLMFVNPEYLKLLTTTRIGVVVLSGACSLMVIGFVWMRRVTRLDV